MAIPKEIQQLMNKIRKRVAANSNRIAIVGLKALEGAYRRRIFNNGQATDGSRIGQYSTKDILVGRSSFATKSAANKVLGSKKKRAGLGWVTVKGQPLAILKGGYKEVRRLSGRQTDYVDLDFRGDLFRGFGIGVDASGSPVLGFFSKREREKAEANESRFKKDIFAVSTKEQAIGEKAAIRELDIILKNL